MRPPTGWHLYRPADLGRCGKQYFRKADFFGAEVWLTKFAALGALQFLAAQGGGQNAGARYPQDVAKVAALRGHLARGWWLRAEKWANARNVSLRPQRLRCFLCTGCPALMDRLTLARLSRWGRQTNL